MKSITRQLVLLFSLISASVIVALVVFISHSVERHFEQSDQQELHGKLELIRHAFHRVQSPAQFDVEIKQLRESLVGHHNLTVAIYAPNGELLYPSNISQVPAAIRKYGPSAASPISIRNAEYRVLAARVSTSVAEPPFVNAILATNIAHHTIFMRDMNRSLSIVVVVSIAFIGVMGFAVTRRGLLPLRKLTHSAGAISAEQLHSRLDMSELPVELKQLGLAFNDMLERLEKSFRRLSDFSADIAHELRTPLSNLVLQTQVILSQPRTAEDYRAALFSNLEEYERLSRMIADMLFLAKADNDMVVLQREPIDLAREIETLFEYFNILAEEHGITLRYHGTAQASADRSMLQRALHNLLVNAIQHTERGGTVNLALQNTTDGGAIVTVSNPGAEIAPEHLDRIFDRFYRIDMARQRQSEGAGLGLAITQSILRAHGGSITVTSKNGCTTFTIEIPSPKKLGRNLPARGLG